MAKPKLGRPNNNLSESAYLVRAPAELHDAMREQSVREQRTLAAVWRRAAEEYLKTRNGKAWIVDTAPDGRMIGLMKRGKK